MTSFDSSLGRRLLAMIAAVALSLAMIGCAASRQQQGDEGDGGERTAGLSRDVSDAVLSHVISGSVHESQGQYLHALHDYNQALLYDSTQAQLYHAVAEMYQHLGELESARLILQRGVHNVPKNPELLRHLGEIQFQLKRIDEAVRTFEKLVGLEPEDRDAWVTLAALYERAGRPMEAVACYDRLLEMDTENRAMLLGRQATLLVSAQEYERAIEAYQQLMQLQPDAHMLPFFIGGLYLDLNDTSKAAQYFEMATDKAPGIPRYWDLRVRIAAIQKDTSRALRLADSAVVNSKPDAELFTMLGAVYLQYGQLDKGEKTLLRAAELDTTSVDPLMALGFSYHDRGMWEQAERTYQRALERTPGDPQVLNNYAYMLAEAGHSYERALEYVDDALAAERRNASFLDTKGWLLYRMGRFDEAREYLEKAQDLQPDNAEILDHLGDLYRALGKNERAKQMWTQALKNGGQNLEIQSKLDELP